MLEATSATASLSSVLWQALWACAALLGVCALAVVILRALAQRGIGLPTGARQRDPGPSLLLEQRLPLGGRQWVYVVRAGEQRWLLGGSEAAGVRMLAELGVPIATPAEQAEQAEAAGLPQEEPSDG